MIQDLLSQRRDAIIKRWQNLIWEGYSPDAIRLFKNNRDQFANPVGTAFKEETGNIFDELVKGFDCGNLYGPLDRIVRIRAVQDFTPSDALGFIFQLKKAAIL